MTPNSIKKLHTIPQTSQEQVKQEQRKVNPEYEYVMKAIPRGKCLIVSNKHFETSDLSTRHGTEHDAQNLEKTFKWLHFEVDVVQDCTTDLMTEQIRKYSEDLDNSHKYYDCFVCCILSHGSKEGIYGTDGERIDMDYIRKMFLGDVCLGLHGKPKLFFIQACRGDEQDRGRRIESDSSSSSSSSSSSAPPKTPAKHSSKVLPVDSDFVFVYATTPGKTYYKCFTHKYFRNQKYI